MVAHLPIFNRLIATLSEASSAEDVLTLAASEQEEQRMDELNDKNKRGVLSTEEEIELNEYVLAEELIGLAKVYAYRKLQMPPA